MNTPPHHPGSQPPSITVGGPNGIVIQGDRVQVGGRVVNPGSPSLPSASAGQVAQLAQNPGQDLRSGGGMEMELFRRPQRLPRLLLAGGLLMGLMAIVVALPAMGSMTTLSLLASVWALLSIIAAFVLRAKSRALQASRALPPELEHALLELAHQQGGELQVPETARALKIPLDEAQEALERLAKRGHADLEVKNEGQLVYKISQGGKDSPAALPAP